ncbi:MAG: homoserine kinase [Burkholderiales bacterium]|jgi:homoserine kinase type II|nr:homoserine kinase [Burkholderiales bacterium]
MSVYTNVTTEELSAWLERYKVGALRIQTPIAAGIENTNYFVTTEISDYVLTLYERLPAADLPFYLGLMAHLAQARLPVPMPEADCEGHYFSMLNGKPAGLIARVAGAPQLTPTTAHCAAIGEVLARMHLAVTDYSRTLESSRGRDWREAAAQAVRPFLSETRRHLLDTEMAAVRDSGIEQLPRGAIHGDLFRDNVLFDDPEGTCIGGIIDFGFAATDAFGYDLAIAVNDWCIADPVVGDLDPLRVAAMLDAYQNVRAPTDDEKARWPLLLRAGALRFWLSRLYDYYLPREGLLVYAHDPAHFERILYQRASLLPDWPISEL